MNRMTTEEAPRFRRVPEDMFETTGVNADGGILQSTDGSLMLLYGGGVFETQDAGPQTRYSRDNGKTWTSPEPLNCEIGVGGVKLCHDRQYIVHQGLAPDEH